MKITIPIAASAVVLALALTGCSSGGLPGSSSAGGSGGSGGSGSAGGSSTHAYSADDLVTILKKAQATLGVTGTIQDNAQLKAILDKGGTKKQSFVQLMASEGAKIVPASCGTALDALTSDANEYGEGGTGIGAELNYTNFLMGISATTNGTTAPAALVNKVGTQLNTLAQNCSKFAINLTTGGTTTKMTMAVDKLSASTNASQTYAFEEDITIPGETKVTKTATIVAFFNGLYVSDTAFTSANIPALEKAVNAVVAAAN